jgi:hypothetical protein
VRRTLFVDQLCPAVRHWKDILGLKFSILQSIANVDQLHVRTQIKPDKLALPGGSPLDSGSSY